MGFLDFLFGKKKPTTFTATVKSSENTNKTEDDDYFYDDVYFNMLRNRPHITNYFGRTFDLPAYSDSFETLDNHKLREWLLLVWWGKTKNGRKKDTTIPKYFFHNYSIDAERLTSIFKGDGLLEDNDEKTFLTEKGKVFFNKYKSLWEIHSFKHYPTNLDLDFPMWNLQLMEMRYFEMEISYLSDSISHTKKMIDRLNYLSNKKPNRRIKQEVDYYINESNSNLVRLNDLKEKLKVLKDKQNVLE